MDKRRSMYLLQSTEREKLNLHRRVFLQIIVKLKCYSFFKGSGREERANRSYNNTRGEKTVDKSLGFMMQ